MQRVSERKIQELCINNLPLLCASGGDIIVNLSTETIDVKSSGLFLRTKTRVSTQQH